MRPSNSRRLVLAMVASAVVAPFVLFSTPLRPWSGSGPLLMVWQELVYPFEYLWSSTWQAAGIAWHRYLYLVDTERENAVLRHELMKLRTRLLDYDEQVKESQRLRQLLGFAERFDVSYVVAEVVGISAASPFRTLRVTRGREAGLRVGMPVLSAEGVVGRIIRVGRAFADVQLLVDSNFRLDVLVQRTRMRGVLSGHGGDRCRFQLHRQAEIKIDDRLITSGIVGGFPKGLPVGRVVRISYAADNVAQVVTVAPRVDYRRLEEVVIPLRTNPEIEKIEETAGRAWFERVVRQRAIARGLP